MATLHIRDETYHKLASKAAAVNMSVQDLVEPALECLANGAIPVGSSPLEGRRQAFESWQRAVEQRAGRYPMGHRIDDSRDAIYGGAEERGV